VSTEEGISTTMILQCKDSPRNQKMQALMQLLAHHFHPWSRQLLVPKCASLKMQKETFGALIFNRLL
jgi:hypothetical protein